MAGISRDEVHRVARLARLSLTDEEAGRMAAELETILAYVEKLAELDTTDVEPTSHVIPLPTPMRPDNETDAIDPELALSNAPERDGTAFVVPKVIDSEAEG